MYGTSHGAHKPCDMPGAQQEQTSENLVPRHDSDSGGRSFSPSHAGSLSDTDDGSFLKVMMGHCLTVMMGHCLTRLPQHQEVQRLRGICLMI